jgi:hypothetical protein
MSGEGLEGGLELGEHRPPRRRCTEMNASQFCHEGFPHPFASFFKKLGAD